MTNYAMRSKLWSPPAFAAGLSLTYFEFGTLAAMQLFVQAAVDVAILEVGLGGRLDAVNIFDADCAVLTSVDFDHMDYLGKTREMIGFEKAGIFEREGCDLLRAGYARRGPSSCGDDWRGAICISANTSATPRMRTGGATGEAG